MKNHRRISVRRLRLCRRRRFGGAVLETALFMPILVMLTFGGAEYSYYFYIKSALSGAARDGVRAAIPSTATESSVTTAISTSLSASNIPSSMYTVTTSPSDVSTAAAGSAVTVTITATWGTIGVTPLPTSMGGIATTKQIVASCVMMKE